MFNNFNPNEIDNDYIHQEDEFMNPEYKDREEEIKRLQLLEAIKQKQKLNQYPVGTDMYYEMQEPVQNFDDFMRGYDPRFDPYGE